MNNTAKKSTSQVRTNLLWRVRIDRQKLVSYQSLIKFIKTSSKVFISPTRGRSLSSLYWLVYQIIMATPGLPTQAAFQVPISTCHMWKYSSRPPRGRRRISHVAVPWPWHGHDSGVAQVYVYDLQQATPLISPWNTLYCNHLISLIILPIRLRTCTNKGSPNQHFNQPRQPSPFEQHMQTSCPTPANRPHSQQPNRSITPIITQENSTVISTW